MTQPQEIQDESNYSESNLPPEVRQKLHDMQERINQLENELKQARAKKPWRPILTKDHAYFLAVVLLAAIPPALVVAERWMRVLQRNFLDEYWSRYSFLSQLMLPPYFLIITVCFVVLGTLLYFGRSKPVVVGEEYKDLSQNRPVGKRQRYVGLAYILAAAAGFLYIVIRCLIVNEYPGWSLLYVWLAFMIGCVLLFIDNETVKTYWKQKGQLHISLLLVHMSLVAVLIGHYSHPQALVFFYTLLVVSLTNLWQFRREIPPIFWIMSLALVVYTINLTGWWTSAVGDEYSFQDPALNLAERTSYTTMGRLLFRGDGVIGTHPYISTFIHALSMKFFGHENFGWRFSNPYICFLAVGLFYYFCKSFISERLALVAAFLLAVSSYIMAFAKIGYNNLQALFALTLVLAISAWALRSRLTLAFACLGSALAFCFYVYPAALYIVPLPFLLFFFYYPPKGREAVKHWGLTIITMLALTFPLMMQPAYWQAKVAGTLFNQPEIMNSPDSFLMHFVDNAIYAFVSFLYIPSESHFVASSYLDPISSALFLIGFLLLIFQLRRQRFPIFVLVWFAYFLFAVGVSHDRKSPPNTRMFMMLPLYMLIASWGFEWIRVKFIELIPSRVRVRQVIGLLLAATILTVNIYQAYPLSHTRFSFLQNIEALFIRITENVLKAEPNQPKDYLVVVDGSWGIDGLIIMQKIYPHLGWASIHQLTLTEPVIPEESKDFIKQRNTIVLFMPWMDVEWVRKLEPQFMELGKEECMITTYTGEKRFPLFHAPDLQSACAP